MKTAISMPDPLFKASDELATRLGISLSELFQRAMERLLREYDDQLVTDALNRVYSSESSDIDPMLTRMQSVSLRREDR
jgi:metal-responsive CopG/Arc/MetJ family transcriptional regulator